MRLPFVKYEGLGNDFIVVELEADQELSNAAAIALCDRHRGIGADGVLLTGLSPAGRPFMKVINADGSQPEMCGNGLRCVALYLTQLGRVGSACFDVDTDAGPHEVEVTVQGDCGIVRVGMRPASLAAAEVLRDARGEHIEQLFEVDGRALHLTTVSMGNPHAVLFAGFAGQEAVLGPRIERDPRFRAGANVGFAQLNDAHSIALRVWERGVGFTEACGTGACAAAVAAVETGRAARGERLTVMLPGGALEIVVRERGERIEMRGPARRVFRGEIELERAS